MAVLAGLVGFGALLTFACAVRVACWRFRRRTPIVAPADDARRSRPSSCW